MYEWVWMTTFIFARLFLWLSCKSVVYCLKKLQAQNCYLHTASLWRLKQLYIVILRGLQIPKCFLLYKFSQMEIQKLRLYCDPQQSERETACEIYSVVSSHLNGSDAEQSRLDVCCDVMCLSHPNIIIVNKIRYLQSKLVRYSSNFSFMWITRSGRVLEVKQKPHLGLKPFFHKC